MIIVPLVGLFCRDVNISLTADLLTAFVRLNIKSQLCSTMLVQHHEHTNMHLVLLNLITDITWSLKPTCVKSKDENEPRDCNGFNNLQHSKAKKIHSTMSKTGGSLF